VPSLGVCFTTIVVLKTLLAEKHSLHEWWCLFRKMGYAAGAASVYVPLAAWLFEILIVLLV
jgi:hypothetical protein